jgi:hypothetical protein
LDHTKRMTPVLMVSLANWCLLYQLTLLQTGSLSILVNLVFWAIEI